MTIGISKEELRRLRDHYFSLGINPVIDINNLIEQCKELNPWLPIENAPKNGTRVLLSHPAWDAASTGCFDGSNWIIQPGILPFKNQPTHYQELPPKP